MKIFLDTNVLVSALTARGLCADLYAVITERHDVVLGEVVITELERILRTKLKVPAHLVDRSIQALRRNPVHATADELSPHRVRDPDDAWVLATAISAGAQILVTGDKDLLAVASEVEELQIITPRELWLMLNPPV